jgi:hypothetical protein
MTARKQTPDVLGDLLSGELAEEPAELISVAPRRTARTTAQSKPKPRATAASTPGSQTQWEYLVVTFQHYRGWRPRYANGQELNHWTEMPLLPDYLNVLGELGWQLSAASSGQTFFGNRDLVQLYFRRARE